MLSHTNRSSRAAARLALRLACSRIRMKNRKLRVILWILALGVVGYWGARFLLPVDPAVSLAQSIDANQRGVAAYDQKNFAEATTFFDAAVRDAQRGMLAIVAAEKRKPTIERRDQLRKIAA